MTTFDKREAGFENKFAHDEELRLKALAVFFDSATSAALDAEYVPMLGGPPWASMEATLMITPDLAATMCLVASCIICSGAFTLTSNNR